MSADGITMGLDSLLQEDRIKKQNKKTRTQREREWEHAPVIVCVGSDLAIGDSLGPITGSMLKYKTQGLKTFIYGTLASPVTAKEIRYLRAFLKETHKGSQIIAVDAAVGAEGDVGLLKLSDSPLFPGAGANKKLGAIGDISIMGIVAEKSLANYGLLNTTRLNLVYTMSEIVSEAIATVLYNRVKNSLSLETKRENG
jgi:putative sporulation protein YyaC